MSNGILLYHPIEKFIAAHPARRGVFDKASMTSLWDHWLKRKPKWAFSPWPLLNALSEHIEAVRPEVPKSEDDGLQFIETTGRVPFPSDIELAERVFGCRVINNVGCREIWNIAYECPAGALHINDQTAVVDLVDDAGALVVDYNKSGNVIVTSLVNYMMPFVKYATGDRGTILQDQCPCGSATATFCFAQPRFFECLGDTASAGLKMR
jgi:phenylacetate-CoA ligase